MNFNLNVFAIFCERQSNIIPFDEEANEITSCESKMLL